jgi:acyl carrier protein
LDGAVGLTLSATSNGAERKTAITELIREKVAAMLEFPDLADVEADVDFTDLGVDSLLAVELRKELCGSLSISFPTPEIFSNPTARMLAQFLDGHLEKVGSDGHDGGSGL